MKITDKAQDINFSVPPLRHIVSNALEQRIKEINDTLQEVRSVMGNDRSRKWKKTARRNDRRIARDAKMAWLNS